MGARDGATGEHLVLFMQIAENHVGTVPRPQRQAQESLRG
jgi:hypothetical protein